MKHIIIEPTKFSPRVELNPTGEILIHGRSIVEDSHAFYTPILEWVSGCESNSLKVEVKLDYMNTSSSKQIYSLLILIQERFDAKNVLVNWFYEEGDEDIYELGKEFESQLGLTFCFYEFAEILS
jgi:hypothetical protein